MTTAAVGGGIRLGGEIVMGVGVGGGVMMGIG